MTSKPTSRDEYPTSLNGGEPQYPADVRVGEEHQRTADPGRNDRGASRHAPKDAPKDVPRSAPDDDGPVEDD